MTRRRIPMLATLLVFFLAVMLVGLVPFRQILNQREAVAGAEGRLHALERANVQLEEDIEALQTPVEIERRAREDFGLVRPGEVAYIVVPTEPTETEDTAPDPAARSWFDSIVDFFTGRNDS